MTRESAATDAGLSEHQRIADEASAKRAAAAEARPRNEDGTLTSGRTVSAATGTEDNERKAGKAREAAAAATGTNRGAVQRAEKLKKLAAATRTNRGARLSAGWPRPTRLADGSIDG